MILLNNLVDTVVGEISSQIYTGVEIIPTVTVTDPLGNQLEEGKYYEVTYDDNTDVGTATVTLTGKGNYDGTKTVTFVIEPDFSGISDLAEDTVTSENKADIEAVKEMLENADTTGRDEETLQQWNEKLDTCNKLLNRLESAESASETEIIQKTEDITADNVTTENKNDLQAAKSELEQALKNFGNNYTEEEKFAIQKEIDRIDDALEIIEHVEKVEEQICKLPDTITKEDADDIKAAEEAKADIKELNDSDETEAPATGDNTNIFLWMVLLLAGGGAVTTLTICNKKKRAEKR